MLFIKCYPMELFFLYFLLLDRASSHDAPLQCRIQISEDQFGFHRTLCYDIEIFNMEHRESSILIKETLPKDIYVDPYEVFEKNGILVKESVDCEIPAYLAKEMELQLCSTSMTHIHHICVPVHFRYQVPHHCGKNGKSKLVEMKMPSFFLLKRNLSTGPTSECFQNSDMNSWFHYENPEVEVLKFQIPVGCTEHFFLVLILTILTIGLSVAYLLFNLFNVDNRF